MSEKTDILHELAKPFSVNAVQWRPGATNKDKTRAQALAYVDLREYQDRLDKVVPGAWEVRVEPLNGTGALKVSLTILGVTREDVGEASPEDDNTYTSAFAQGFKRACAAFGLGRYLYRLPKAWCAYDPNRRILLESPVLPEWAVPEEERSWYFESHGGQRTVPANGSSHAHNGQGSQTAKAAKSQANGNGHKADGEIRIHFGKNKGKALTEVDEGWLRWYAASAKPRTKQDERL
ncbi:MAG TPA: hypothetical protein EYP54_04330, partial [Anaerolineales bacterium]|nr:hypothetical protein [Anaerolineales bacterium]